LFKLLADEEIVSTLAYIVTFNNYCNLAVKAHENCIEISNDEIAILIVLYVGFEEKENHSFKNKHNVHLITFSLPLIEMIEFKELNVKFIDKTALLFSILGRSKKEERTSLRILNDLIL
jgi:hypothetical protein